jgi:hypothetical protein
MEREKQQEGEHRAAQVLAPFIVIRWSEDMAPIVSPQSRSRESVERLGRQHLRSKFEYWRFGLLEVPTRKRRLVMAHAKS